MDMPVTSSARVTCRDASWPLSQLTLAGMSWSSPAAAVPSRPLVLLHGWLDNCLSFTRLAPGSWPPWGRFMPLIWPGMVTPGTAAPDSPIG